MPWNPNWNSGATWTLDLELLVLRKLVVQLTPVFLRVCFAEPRPSSPLCCSWCRCHLTLTLRVDDWLIVRLWWWGLSSVAPILRWQHRFWIPCWRPCFWTVGLVQLDSISLDTLLLLPMQKLNTQWWHHDMSLLVRILDSITYDLISSCSWVFAVWIVYAVYTIFVNGFVTPPNGFGTQFFTGKDLAAIHSSSKVWFVVQLEPLLGSWNCGLGSEGTKARVRWGLKSRSALQLWCWKRRLSET